MDGAKYSRYYTYISPVIKNPILRSSLPTVFNLVALIIFTLFAIRPTVSTILNLQQNIENNKTILESLVNKARDLTLGKNNLESMDPELRKKIATAVPIEANVTGLIANLQSAVPAQVTISSLQIQPLTLVEFNDKEKVPSQLTEVDFSLNTEGPYPSLLTLLENLNRSPRVVNIASAALSREGTGSANLSLTGKAYFLK